MRQPHNPFVVAQLYFRARAALRHARRLGIPGLDLDGYGRRLGLRLLARGQFRKGLSHLLHPIALTRYFEYGFAAGALPPAAGLCVDLSSPRLFGLYCAERKGMARVDMFNPDVADLDVTQRIARTLGIRNIETISATVDNLGHRPETYDCAWSISVIEHISGAYDDRAAIRWLFDALKPGGTLILTVPVDRRFRDEYRDEDPYGTQPQAAVRRYFFQRWYDWSAIESRLLATIGFPPHQARFFGELQPGRFSAWDERSRREGLRLTIDDPREIADGYREFTDWASMPGMGVCGLRIQKP